MNHVSKNVLHSPLIGSTSILQPERHHCVTVDTDRTVKSYFFFIFGRHPDLVVSDEGVHEVEQSESGRRIHQLVDLWKWKAVLWTGPIQVGVVGANPPLSVGFLDHDNIGEPVGICGFSDEARLE